MKTRLFHISLMLALFTHPSHGQIPDELDDGWHGWSVRAQDNTQSMCCFSQKSLRDRSRTCSLDDQRGWTSNSDLPASDLNVFVKLEEKKVAEIKTWSASCPIRDIDQVQYYESVSQQESVHWLQRFVTADSRRLSLSALASIAVHQGDEAQQTLLEYAESAKRTRIRKESIFWLGQTRASTASATILAFMFDDENPEIREHAAFSWSQTDVENRDADLIRLGVNDASTKVRAQAWFWLSQTALPHSEVAITRAVADDSSQYVRNQAVFALSQLPEDRALDALSDVIEDPKSNRRTRKQALFWLADLDSDAAMEYLDKLLD